MMYPEKTVSLVNERALNLSGIDRFVLKDNQVDLFAVDSRDNTVRGLGTSHTSDGVGNTTTKIHVAGATFTPFDVGKTIEFTSGLLSGRRVIVTSVPDATSLVWTGAEPSIPGAITFRLSGAKLLTEDQVASSRILTASSVDGATLTAAAAATAIPAANVITLPAGYWRVGRMWRLRATGRISNVITTPGTARFDLRFGAVVAFDTLAIPLNIAAKTNEAWLLDVLLTCRSVGTGVAAKLIGQGSWLSESNLNVAAAATGPGPGGCLVPFDTAPVVGTGFDSTLTQAVDFFFTQTVATGSLTVHQYVIEQLN